MTLDLAALERLHSQATVARKKLHDNFVDWNGDLQASRHASNTALYNAFPELLRAARLAEQVRAMYARLYAVEHGDLSASLFCSDLLALLTADHPHAQREDQ